MSYNHSLRIEHTACQLFVLSCAWARNGTCYSSVSPFFWHTHLRVPTPFSVLPSVITSSDTSPVPLHHPQMDTSVQMHGTWSIGCPGNGSAGSSNILPVPLHLMQFLSGM